jgi:predicted ArsR family transcriptional regulator
MENLGGVKLDKRKAILDLTRRRPITLLDISSALGIHKNEAIKYVQDLLKKKIIHTVFHDGQNYYRSS